VNWSESGSHPWEMPGQGHPQNSTQPCSSCHGTAFPAGGALNPCSPEGTQLEAGRQSSRDQQAAGSRRSSLGVRIQPTGPSGIKTLANVKKYVICFI
jgi:hypothetical protein